MLMLQQSQPFFRFIALVTILTFFPSSVAVWNFIPPMQMVAEAQQPAESRSATDVARVADQQPGLSLLTPGDLSARGPDPRQRFANLPVKLPAVESFFEKSGPEEPKPAVVAQADIRAPLGPAEAAQRLTEANTLRNAGLHTDAGLAYLSIVNDYGVCEESRLAHEGLMEMMYDAINGTIASGALDQLENRWPSWDSLIPLAQYVLVAYYGERAETAAAVFNSGEVDRCYAQCRVLAQRFYQDHPESPWLISTMIYYYDAARHAGPEDRAEVLSEMRGLTESMPPCMARLTARCVLAEDAYTLANNMGEASIHCRDILTESGSPYVQEVFTDPYVYYWVKGQLRLYLGQACEMLGKYADARNQFLSGVADVAYRSLTRDLLALRAVEMWERMDPQNAAAAVAAYGEYLTQYPDSRVADRAWWLLARVYFLAGDYDGAAAAYRHVVQNFPDSRYAESARNEIGYLATYLLGTTWVADGRPVLAGPSEVEMARLQWCGPKALSRLLHAEGYLASAEELAKLAGTDESGTSMQGLIDAAKLKGYDLIGLSASQVEDVPAPFIAHVDGNHFVVVTGVRADSVVVADGDQPEQALTRQEFHGRWDGKALVRPDRVVGVGESMTVASLVSTTGGNWGEATFDDNPVQNWSLALSPLLPTTLSEPGVHVWIDAFETAMEVKETDLSMAVKGDLSLSFTRVFMNEKGYPRGEYVSSYPAGGNIGRGWTHNQNVHLRTSSETPPLTVTLYDAVGAYRVYDYDSTAGGKNYYYRSSTGTTEERGNTLTRDTTTLKYTLETPSGLKYNFSAATADYNRYARLESVEDKAGNALTYAYNGAVGTGRLTKVSAPSGDARYLQFSYDFYNRISKAELKDSGGTLMTAQYAYVTANSRLTKVTDNGGATVEYTMYSYPNQPETLYMTAIKDKMARTHSLAWTFSVTGGSVLEATKIDVTDAGGLKTTFDRSASTSVCTVTGWNGATNLSKSVSTPVSSDASRGRYMDSYLDASTYERWTWEYDGSGDHTKRLRPDTSDDVTYTHTSLGQLSTASNNSGATVTYTYAANGLDVTNRRDWAGLDTTFEYDANRLVTKTVTPVSGANGVQYAYDGYGQVTAVTNPLSQTSAFVYDSMGRLSIATNPLSNSTTSEYDSVGNVTKTTDARGKSTYFYYAYGGCGGCGGAMGLLTKVKDALDNETIYAYDVNGNQTKITDALGRATDYFFDTMNRLTKVESPSASGTYMTQAYDKLGQITRATDLEGKVVDYNYDFQGTLTSQSDGVGTYVEYTYQSSGVLSTARDGNGEVTSYDYDLDGFLTKITYADGKVSKYFYDSAGRQTKVAAGSSGTVDPAESFYHATTGLLTKARFTAGGDASDAVYAYNENGQLTKLTDWIDGTDGLRYGYDAGGRLTTLTDYDDSTLEYTYDAAGNVLTMEDYHGSVFVCTYTDTNRLSTITAPGSKTWTYTYNAVGQPTQVSVPNGMTTVYGYDGMTRLTKIEHKDGANVLDGFYYALDKQGKITNTAYQDDAYWDYWYDARYRLTKAERRDNADALLHRYTYAYDAGNNMTTKEIYDGTDTDTYVYAYTAASELTKQTFDGTDTAFEYDAWGRMTSKSDGTHSASYYWNYGQVLTKLSSSFPEEGTVTYEYGGNGGKRERDDGTITKYRTDSGLGLVNEENSGGTLTRTYVGGLATVAGATPATGDYAYSSRDILGSARRLRDQSKASAGVYEFDPYGATYLQSGVSLTEGFGGQIWDPVSGLLSSKPYLPTIGRSLARGFLGTSEPPGGDAAYEDISRWAEEDRQRKQKCQGRIDRIMQMIEADAMAKYAAAVDFYVERVKGLNALVEHTREYGLPRPPQVGMALYQAQSALDMIGSLGAHVERLKVRPGGLIQTLASDISEAFGGYPIQGIAISRRKIRIDIDFCNSNVTTDIKLKCVILHEIGHSIDDFSNLWYMAMAAVGLARTGNHESSEYVRLIEMEADQFAYTWDPNCRGKL